MVTTRRNVLGGPLEPCSLDPLTGWRRDGRCAFDPADFGRHHVCAVMTEEFLAFSRSVGNDLSTPRPEFAFPGLKPGDRWCVCALRWEEARRAGVAPPVVLEATDAAALEVLHLGHLQAHAVEVNGYRHVPD
ncbi:MAG: DUF2237 domain-containing protein [Sphingomonadaceae bacterium]|uniref:DUF2237 family protein n=1 Tax=Thermaurantiacus sp. TaxID=2820283 RepID=UPI00298F2033|nr:DUF2237 domain-containing protein [Thermaurantiacus sp.]MCS6985957.1 DUF2237 domain-containing protein [Sphingomonadaceae bacterium]MDW8414827.1 DUF2237 domain-containing protein [Thermaurantiacus sp.]